MKKKLHNLLYFLAFLILFVLIYIPLHLLYQTPPEKGKISLSGLKQKVEVYRDIYGIPYIFANNQQDAYYSLGYVQASERLWQIQLLKRVVSGRLAEVIGPQGILIDQTFRSLGLRYNFSRWLAQNHQNLLPQSQIIVDSYLAGINQFIENGPIPLEMYALGMTAEPLQREDILALVAYLAFCNSQPIQTEPVLEQLQQKIGLEKLNQLLKTRSRTKPIPGLSDNPIPFASIGKTLALFGYPNLRTSRSPFKPTELAIDMQMPLSLPNFWFEAYLNYPNFELYGYFFPFAPFAISGFNSKISWTISLTNSDDVDFYRETLNPTNPHQTIFAGEPIDIQTREEIIRVKNHDSIIHKIRISHNGPIINEINGNLAKKPISMKWLLFSNNNRPFAFFTKLNHSQNLPDLQEASKNLISPPTRIQFSQRDGSSATLQNTNPLLRNYHSDQWQPGHLKKFQWQIQQPEVEMDTTSRTTQLSTVPHYLHCPTFLPFLLTAIGNQNPQWLTQKDRQSLKDFQCQVDKNSSTSSIYINFYHFLAEELFADEMGNTLLTTIRRNGLLNEFLIRTLKQEQSPFWDNTRTAISEKKLDILLTALKKAIEKSKNNADKWTAPITIPHPLSHWRPFSLPINIHLKRFFPPGPIDETHLITESAFGSSFRLLVEHSRATRFFSIQSVGNTSHFLSNYYDNQLSLYSKGKMRANSLTRIRQKKEKNLLILYPP